MEKTESPQSASKPPKLLDQVRAEIRLRHFSYRTEQSYVHWIRRFILHHGKRHPREMGASEIGAFLTHLAVDRKVSASTQNQALNALIFLYRHVLKTEVGEIVNLVRAKRPQRIPEVLSREEVRRVLDGMSGIYQLMARLLYGSGMRLMECVRLRVKDIDLERCEITVRSGKGDKDRRTMLPLSLKGALEDHLRRTRLLYEEDRRAMSPAFNCRRGWSENTPTPERNGPGSGCFQPPDYPAIRGVEPSAGIMSWKITFSAQSKRPHGGLI